MATTKRSTSTARAIAKKVAGTSRNRSRSASSGRFVSGQTVRVQFGAHEQDATVLEHHGDRVRVGIALAGVEEPIVSTYKVGDVRSGPAATGSGSSKTPTARRPEIKRAASEGDSRIEARGASSGRYVSQNHGNSRSVSRSAATGKFVAKATAARNPGGTIQQQV